MRWPWSGDHPRSRGVYNKVISKILVRNGSSPLARGLPGAGAQFLGGLGIIPARAGFTGRVFPSRIHARDHPRSRGVYLTL